MFLTLALIGYFALAIVAITDKFILSEQKVKPIVFTFYSAFPVLAVFFLLPFYGQPLNSRLDFFIATISGVAFALGLWTMYLGFLKSEVSHIGPLVGGLTPLFVLFFGQWFLGEILSGRVFIGVLLLSLGTLVVAFEYKKRHYELNNGVAWGMLAALLFALSHVSAKYIYDSYDFSTGFIWTRGLMGVFGVLLLLSPILRKELFGPSASTPSSPPPSATLADRRAGGEKRSSGHLALIFTNKILGVTGTVLIQYAIALGSVTIVNALAGAQFAILIMLVFLLSRFWPKLFKEEYSRAEIIQEVGAIILIGLGLVMIV